MMKALPASICTVVLSLFQTLVYAVTPDVPVEVVPIDALLPEVAEIVLHPEPPDAAKLRQNAYVGLLAMDAPEGMDYMAIGSKVILNNFYHMTQAIQTLGYEQQTNVIDEPYRYYENKNSLRFNGKTGGGVSYVFPCIDLQAHGCAAQIGTQKENIATLVTQNKLLLNRYLQIAELPDYHSHLYSYFELSLSLRSGSYINRLGNLLLAQAVLAFQSGNSDEGFALLQSEMAIAKKMFSGQTIIIDHIMLAQLRLYINYHVISSLMDMPEFHPYLADKRLEALLEPLSAKEQAGLAQTFINERNLGLIIGYASKELLPGTGIGYDRYANSNIYYLMYEPIIERASLSLSQVSELYVHNKLSSLEEEISKILEEQNALYAQKNGALFNMMGQLFLREFPTQGPHRYLNQIYDVHNYIALVHAKYQIIKAGIGEEEIPEFLLTLGEQGRNPYTQQPFVWNANTHVLSSIWIEPDSSIAKAMPVIGVFIRPSK